MKMSDADVMEVILSVDKNFDGEVDFSEGEKAHTILLFCCVFSRFITRYTDI